MDEGEINQVVDNTNTIITEDGGKIIELDRWGMRKLAYPIKKESQGFYIFCDYSGVPEAVAEIERKFRIDDAVLRYMTVKTAEAITDEEIAAATDQAADKKTVEEETAGPESEESKTVETTTETINEAKVTTEAEESTEAQTTADADAPNKVEESSTEAE